MQSPWLYTLAVAAAVTDDFNFAYSMENVPGGAETHKGAQKLLDRKEES